MALNNVEAKEVTGALDSLADAKLIPAVPANAIATITNTPTNLAGQVDAKELNNILSAIAADPTYQTAATKLEVDPTTIHNSIDCKVPNQAIGKIAVAIKKPTLNYQIRTIIKHGLVGSAIAMPGAGGAAILAAGGGAGAGGAAGLAIDPLQQVDHLNANKMDKLHSLLCTTTLSTANHLTKTELQKFITVFDDDHTCLQIEDSKINIDLTSANAAHQIHAAIIQPTLTQLQRQNLSNAIQTIDNIALPNDEQKKALATKLSTLRLANPNVLPKAQLQDLLTTLNNDGTRIEAIADIKLIPAPANLVQDIKNAIKPLSLTDQQRNTIQAIIFGVPNIDTTKNEQKEMLYKKLSTMEFKNNQITKDQLNELIRSLDDDKDGTCLQIKVETPDTIPLAPIHLLASSLNDAIIKPTITPQKRIELKQGVLMQAEKATPAQKKELDKKLSTIQIVKAAEQILSTEEKNILLATVGQTANEITTIIIEQPRLCCSDSAECTTEFGWKCLTGIFCNWSSLFCPTTIDELSNGRIPDAQTKRLLYSRSQLRTTVNRIDAVLTTSGILLGAAMAILEGLRQSLYKKEPNENLDLALLIVPIVVAAIAGICKYFRNTAYENFQKNTSSLKNLGVNPMAEQIGEVPTAPAPAR